MLALAHALESHKTLSGEDVTAVFEGGHGPLVNGAPYTDDAFIAKLRDYHLAAKRAHQEHNQPQLTLPVAEPVFAIADPTAQAIPRRLVRHGNGNGNGHRDRGRRPIDVIDFGAGLGTGTGSHSGPLGAPTYDPPGHGRPDDPNEDDHS